MKSLEVISKSRWKKKTKKKKEKEEKKGILNSNQSNLSKKKI